METIITPKQRKFLQLNAFHAAHKLLHDLPSTERFVTAIVQSSDDLFDEAIERNPKLIERWLNEYQGR